MKKFLVIIVVLAAFSKSAAQYRKLPLDTDHVWQQSYFFLAPPTPSVYCDYLLKVKKDSLINGKTYKYLTLTYRSCNNGYLYFESGLIRQDTLLRTVTIYQNNKEYFLYDFSTNVGDTATLLDVS
jgi:hypothetical protein